MDSHRMTIIRIIYTAILAITSLSQLVAESPLTPATFCLILPTSGVTSDGNELTQQLQSIVSLGVSDVNSEFQLHSSSGSGTSSSGEITLLSVDSNGAGGSMGAVLECTDSLGASSSLLGLIGGLDSDSTLAMSELSSALDIPILNPFSGSAILADPSAHAMHVRIGPTDEALAWALYKGLVKSKWYRFVLISLDDPHSRAITDLVTNLLASHATQRVPGADGTFNSTHISSTPSPFDVASFVLSSSNEDFLVTNITEGYLYTLLNQVAAVDYRVFVVIGAAGGSAIGRDSIPSLILTTIFRMAYSLGMIGPKAQTINPELEFITEQWFGVGFCESRTGIIDLLKETFPDADDPFWTGLQCIAPSLPRVVASPAGPVNNAAVAFQSRLQAHDPILFPSTYRLSSEACRAYDTVRLIGYALQKLYTDPSFALVANDAAGFHLALFDVIRTQDITGMEGNRLLFTPGEFNSAGVVTVIPEAILALDYLNWYPDIGAFQTVGTYQPLTHTANYSRMNVFMSDGSHVYSKDRPRVYVDGDDLPPVTLAAQTIVLAYCITVLGLWSSIILIEQSIASWSVEKKLRATGWNFLAGVCIGPCGIFPTFVLNFCAQTLDTLTLRFTPGLFALACIFMVPIITALYGVGCNEEVTGRSTHSRRYAIKGSSGGTTGESANRSKGGSSKGQGRDSRSHMPSSSGSRSFVSQLKRFTTTLRSDLDLIRSWFNPRSVTACLFFAIVVVLNFEILSASLQTEAKYSRPIGSYFIAVIFLWIILWPCIIITFHLHKSSLRYVVPFVKSGAFMATFYILEGNVTWKYATGIEDVSADAETADDSVVSERSGSIHADSTLVVTLSVISFLVVCASMIYNVNSLRLTKNILDKVLAKVQEQVTSIETSIQSEETQRQSIEQSGKFARRSVEVINLCRPIFRPHALALALAEPTFDLESLDQPVAVAKPEGKHHSGKSVADGLLPLPSPKRSSGVGSRHSKSGSKNGRRLASKDKSRPNGEGLKDSSKTGVGGGGIVDVSQSPDGHHRVVKSFDEPFSPMSPEAKESEESKVSGTGSKTSALSGGQTNTMTPAKGVVHVRSRVTKSPPPNATSKSAALALVNGIDFALVHSSKKDSSVLAILKELREFNFTESLPVGSVASAVSPLSPLAVHARLAAEVRLPQLLSNPVTLELVKDTLAKQLSPENLALWIDIQRYRSLDSVSSRRSVADEMYQLYIVNGARFEVNLSSSMKSSLESRLGRGRMSLDLFDEIEREIYRLVVVNNLGDVIGSPVWSKLAAILLGQTDYRMRHVSQLESGGTSVATSHIAGYSSPLVPVVAVPPPVATRSRAPSNPVGTTIPVVTATVGESHTSVAIITNTQPNSRRTSIDKHTTEEHTHVIADGSLDDLKRVVAKTSDPPSVSPVVGRSSTSPLTPSRRINMAAHSHRSNDGDDRQMEEEVDRLVNPGREIANLTNPGKKHNEFQTPNKRSTTRSYQQPATQNTTVMTTSIEDQSMAPIDASHTGNTRTEPINSQMDKQKDDHHEIN